MKEEKGIFRHTSQLRKEGRNGKARIVSDYRERIYRVLHWKGLSMVCAASDSSLSKKVLVSPEENVLRHKPLSSVAKSARHC